MNRITSLNCILPAGLILLAAGLSSPAATNYYVATNGPGGAFTNWATAASNIQDAINVTLAGDVVWVSNGVYNTGGITNYPSGYNAILTNRVAITKAITVRSANNDPANTVIEGARNDGTNGPNAVRCVYMADGSALIGFTLTNGATLASGGGTYDIHGGGVFNRNSATPLVSNCVIAGNMSAGNGGGVYYGTLYNCTISNNSTKLSGYSGGGAYYSVLFDCLVVNNSANGDGGGARWCTMSNCTIAGNSISAVGQGSGARDGTFYNCIIAGNSGGVGGGGAYYSTLYNCLVVSNSTQGVGGGACYCYYLYNCTIANNRSAGNGGGVRDGKYANCIVYGNIPNNWYDTNSFFTNSCTYPTQSTWQVADRNITNDPFFVSTNTGNYHLRQDSACINAGANAYVRTNMPADLDGRSRIDHYSRIVDMGCYEYLPSGSMYSFGF